MSAFGYLLVVLVVYYCSCLLSVVLDVGLDVCCGFWVLLFWLLPVVGG